MVTRDTDAVERLCRFVHERRRRLGLRQQDVADRSGLSLAWIGMLEAKRLKSVPRSETLVKLSNGLLLPTEAPGTLVNFLKLVLSGSLDGRVVRHVALGKQDAQVVLNDAVKGIGVSGLPSGEPDVAPCLFFDQELRSERLDRILAMLKVDLTPDDFTLAQLFLKRLYDEGPVPALTRCLPRRKRPAKG